MRKLIIFLIKLTVNGTFGLIGAPAASHVVVMELRPEKGQKCRRRSTVEKNAKGHTKKHRAVGLSHALVRHSNLLSYK